jgi:serine/threonine-protein kinase
VPEEPSVEATPGRRDTPPAPPGQTLPPDAAGQLEQCGADLAAIDAICDRFEQAWRQASADTVPPIEPLLDAAPHRLYRELLRELLRCDIEHRRAAGSTPRLADYQARFPRDLDLLAEFFPTAAATHEGGHFELHEEIGRGGMGCVLRGRDIELDRDIAVKVLLDSHASHAELSQRFAEEARIAGQLQHPGLAPVYQRGQLADGRPYFTMKLVRGQTLAALLGQRGDAGQDLPRLLKVFEQVCQALAYAHSRGVIHRDLKPANVMVGAFGEVQVMDWGLAKRLASRERQRPETDAAPPVANAPGSPAHTQAGSVLGTPAYMAPEQARGEVVRLDERADVFGLGAMLCEILTGLPPYIGPNSEQVHDQAVRAQLAGAFARLDRCGSDAELVSLCRRCLAAEVDHRPRDAGVLARELTAYLESVQQRLKQAELAAAEARARVVEERKRRRLTMALAGSVLLTLLLGVGGYTWLERQRAQRRAATAHSVETALGRASLVRGQAALAAVGDLSAWVEAQAEVKRAQDLLKQGEADPALRERVQTLAEELQRGREAAQRRADDAAAERRLVTALEKIRGDRGEHFDLKRADRAYAREFRTFGLDLDLVEPKEAGLRLARREATAEIAAALDEWCVIRRILQRRRQQVPSWQRLSEVARLADPEPWRNGLRAMVALPWQERSATLKKQAEELTALERQPPASLILLALMLRDAGEGERSAAVLRLAWRRFPADFWVNHDLGYSSWSDASGGRYERPEEAVRYLTAAVAARPASATAHSNLGNALKDQGKLDEAIACYRKAIALDPKDPKAHNNLGSGLSEQNKREEAIACYRQAIALDPKYAKAHGNLGAVLEQLGKVEEAITALRQAIFLDPKHMLTHYNLGVALAKQGKVEEAIACYQKATLLDPKYALAHGNLGIALKVQGKLTEAIACFHKAIALEPKNARFFNNLGTALAQQGRPEEAIAAYRRAITLDGKIAAVHGNLARALTQQGKGKEAIACFHKAIALDARNTADHVDLGNALFSQGQVDEAVACYHKALALDPNMVAAHIYLGFALRRQGQFVESVKALRRGHALGSRQPNWPNPTAVWVREGERLVLLEKRLPDVLAGKLAFGSSREGIEYARLCVLLNRLLTSAQFYREAFQADPKLVSDQRVAHRYNAACNAARVAAGQGRDAGGRTENERMHWRRQALTWLRAELSLLRRRADRGPTADRAALKQVLRHWQGDPDLAGLRDPKALARLSPEERQACQHLWADVANLCKGATPR